MNCGCHCCRQYGECDEKHKQRDLVRAKHVDGSYWWGKGKEEARGRWVNLCKACIAAFDGGDEYEIRDVFFKA